MKPRSSQATSQIASLSVTTPTTKSSDRGGRSWSKPPITSVRRVKPLLVNYYHTFIEGNSDLRRPEELAQWNVLILNPYRAREAHIPFAEIRRLNPHIKILAWVPEQSPNDPWLRAVVPTEGTPQDWCAHDATGKDIIMPWGRPLYNPYCHDFAWPKAMIAFIHQHVLNSGDYDGLMLDCVAEGPWAGQVDVDGDGKAMTAADQRDWQEGMSYLLTTLRADYPSAIITGNGGNPWTATCPYFQWANGDMDENALGNEWRDQTWQSVWDGINIAESRVKQRELFYFLEVDTRRSRTQEECLTQASLTDADRQRFRLGLCTSMLQDHVYFGFDRGDCLHGQLWWFDEYNSPIGAATGSYEQGRWGKDVYTRPFQNGLVAVNVSGRAVTIAMPKIVTDVSTKTRGRSMIIPPQDGRILVYSPLSN